MSGTQYTLIVQNNSASTWDMCVYQIDPNIGNANVMSLAWFSQAAAPTTTITFEWTVDYSFVWSQTGLLEPGVTFTAAQTWPADPDNVAISSPTTAGNQIGLTDDGGAYTFTSTAASGPVSGTLYVCLDDTVLAGAVSVGIGMSGASTFAVQAAPSIQLDFVPQPAYWIAAGNFVTGEVLNLTEINNPAAVTFLDDVYSMTATLGLDDDWTIQPTSDGDVRGTKRSAAQPRDQLAGKR